MTWRESGDVTSPAELNRLRAAAAQKVRTTELTGLSAELCRPDNLGGRSIGGGGMSPADLKAFLSGFDPDRRNRRSGHASLDTPISDEDGAEAVAVGVLVRDLPPDRRNEGVAVLLETLASFHEEGGVPLPAWLAHAARTTDSEQLNQWADRCEFVSR